MSAVAEPAALAEAELAPLARWVAERADAPGDERLTARLFATMLDYASALASGTGHELFAPYMDALLAADESGPARVAGHSGAHPRAAAAAANAAIAHFYEVDDAHRTSTSHPGIAVIPVVMALAEADPAAAAPRARAAIVAGYEAILRIGGHLGPAHYAKNHTTATAGTFGAAAAAARYMGLSPEATLAAFGHAGTQAAGLWQILDDGATAAKAFHAAMAARSGLAAASMARAGIPGAARVLEGRRGMRAAWGLEGCDPAWLNPHAEPMIHDVTIKGWPVCGQMHSALDCARALFERHGPQTDAACILVEVPKAALDIASVRDPANLAEAKFSTSFCVAATIAGRAPDFRGLDAALLADPDVRALAARCEVVECPSYTARFPRERPARVTLTCADGTTDSEVRAFRGGDPEAPWSEAQLIARSADILPLAAGPVPLDRLVAWARGFATPGAAWRPGDLYDLIPTAGTTR